MQHLCNACALCVTPGKLTTVRCELRKAPEWRLNQGPSQEFVIWEFVISGHIRKRAQPASEL